MAEHPGDDLQADSLVEQIASEGAPESMGGELAREAGDPLVTKAGADRFAPAYLARMDRMSQKRAKAAITRLRDLGKIGPGTKGKPGLRPTSKT